MAKKTASRCSLERRAGCLAAASRNKTAPLVVASIVVLCVMWSVTSRLESPSKARVPGSLREGDTTPPPLIEPPSQSSPCSPQSLGEHAHHLQSDKVWCVEYEFDEAGPTLMLRAFVGGNGIATDDDIYRPGQRKLVNGSTMWWRVSVPSQPHPNAVASAAIFAFGPYIGKVLVAPFPISASFAAALESGITGLPAVQVVNVDSELQSPQLHGSPRAAEPHVALFGGGWDSSFGSLLAPGGHLFHEVWARSQATIPDFTQKEIPLMYGDVRRAWEEREGRTVVPVFTNSKFITSTFGWPSWATVYAGAIMYASAHGMWGLSTGTIIESVVMGKVGDYSLPSRITPEQLPQYGHHDLLSTGPYFRQLFAHSGLHVVSEVAGLPSVLLARLWVREAVRTRRLYRLGLPLVCDLEAGTKCFSGKCSKCMRKELINLAAATQEGLTPDEAVQHLYRHPRTPWASRWSVEEEYLQPPPSKLGTNGMRGYYGLVLQDFVRQHGANKFLPPLSTLDKIAWPPMPEQEWQEHVIEPVFRNYCGPPSLCADVRKTLTAMGAPFADWGSTPLDQLLHWDVREYFAAHKSTLSGNK